MSIHWRMNFNPISYFIFDVISPKIMKHYTFKSIELPSEYSEERTLSSHEYLCWPSFC